MAASTERSFGAVVRDISGNLNRIVRAEFRFVLAEVRVRVEAAAAPVALVAAGLLCAMLATGFVLLGGMFALANVMPMWGAALVVAALAGAGATVLILTGRDRFIRPAESTSSDVVTKPERVE